MLPKTRAKNSVLALSAAEFGDELDEDRLDAQVFSAEKRVQLQKDNDVVRDVESLSLGSRNRASSSQEKNGEPVTRRSGRLRKTGSAVSPPRARAEG